MTITEENVINTVVTAVEGGADYWMDCDPDANPWLGEHGGESFSEKFAQGIMAGRIATICDVEDHSTKWPFSMATLLGGFELFFNDPERCRPFEEHDAEDADVIFQLGLFSEVRYS